VRVARQESEVALGVLEAIRDSLRLVGGALPSGLEDSVRLDGSLTAALARALPEERRPAAETARRFAILLARRRQLGFLGAVTASIRARLDQAAGTVLVQVESGQPLAAENRADLRQALLARTGARDVRLEEKINPALWGGLRLRIGWERIDGSLLGRYESLANALGVDPRGALNGQV